MEYVKELNLKYITDKQGRKKEVIIPLKKFENLLEDLEDLAVAAERRDEDTISHSTLLKELKNDGLI